MDLQDLGSFDKNELLWFYVLIHNRGEEARW